MNQSPPPGYYTDPHGDERWWDGARWTDQVRPAQQAARPVQQQASQSAQQVSQPTAQQVSQPTAQQPWQQHAQWTGTGQPGSPVPPPSRSKLPWIIGGVVVLLLLVGGGILAVVLAADDSDDDSSSPAPGPEDTVQAYFDALAEDDCEGMVDQVTEHAADEPSMNCDTYDRNSMDGVEASNEILDTEEDGDEATVRSREKFVHSEGTFEAECTYQLVKQDDAWLIDDADCDQTSE